MKNFFTFDRNKAFIVAEVYFGGMISWLLLATISFPKKMRYLSFIRQLSIFV